MTYGQGWSPPPAPPPQPRRYATKWVWAGIGIGIVATAGLPAIGLVLAATSGIGQVLGWTVSAIGIVVPLGVGIVLTARQGSPARRGVGLGLIIGWALAPIVFAGVCVIVIVGAYTVPGFPGGVA